MNDFWNQYDVDKNGVLSRDEFKKFLLETFGDEDLDNKNDSQ